MVSFVTLGMNSARLGWRPNRLYKQSAFSLIEVLVALTILAVGLIAASRAATLASFDQSALRDRTLARWVAHNALAEIRLQGTLASVGKNAREYEQAGIRFLAATEVSATPSPLFKRVEVRVARTDNPGYELAQAIGFSSRVQ
jgi:general secretion pathway protein I